MKPPADDPTNTALLDLAARLEFAFAAGDRHHLEAAKHYGVEMLKQLRPIADRMPRESAVRDACDRIDDALRIIGDMFDQKRPKPTAARKRAIVQLTEAFAAAHPDADTFDAVEHVERAMKPLVRLRLKDDRRSADRDSRLIITTAIRAGLRRGT